MDCVDTKLFDDFRKKELKFCTLPVKIYQNFFQRSDSRNVKKYWNRFRIRINDTLYYSRDAWIRLLNKAIQILKFSW